MFLYIYMCFNFKWPHGDRKVKHILLFHNIQTMLNNRNERSFFPFDRFKKEKWDIEHIHAIATEVNVKAEAQKTWLQRNFIQSSSHQNQQKNEQIKSIVEEDLILESADFKLLIQYVLGYEDNNIRNLCLLDRGTNRSYKNDAFKAKRFKIIEREIEGTFIPICTKNVFMKYYSTEVKDLEFWGETDREAYAEDIQNCLNLLNSEDENS